MFARGYTTGGSDLAALLIKLKFAGLPTAKLILALDAAVVIFSAVASGSYVSIFFSFIAIFMSSAALEFVSGGFERTRLAYIFSDHYAAVADALTEKLERGVTVLDGMGWYTKEKKKVVLCVVKKNEIYALKALVKSIDPDAFMILSESTETIGEGFKAGGRRRFPSNRAGGGGGKDKNGGDSIASSFRERDKYCKGDGGSRLPCSVGVGDCHCFSRAISHRGIFTGKFSPAPVSRAIPLIQRTCYPAICPVLRPRLRCLPCRKPPSAGGAPLRPSTFYKRSATGLRPDRPAHTRAGMPPSHTPSFSMRPRLSAPAPPLPSFAESLHPRAHFAPLVLLCAPAPCRARPSRAHPRDGRTIPRYLYKAHRKKTYPRGKTSRTPAEISPPFPMREPRGACFRVSAIPRKSSSPCAPRAKSFSCTCSCPPLAPPLPPKSGYPCAPPFPIRPHCPPPAPPLPSLPEASIRGRAYTPCVFSMQTHPCRSAVLCMHLLLSSARTLRCPPCGKPPSAGALTPFVFPYGRPFPRPTIPRTCGACRHPLSLPYKTRRKNPSLRENIWPPCPPPAPPLPSLRKASIRGRTYNPRLPTRPPYPHPTAPRTPAGNISPISHAHRAPKSFSCGRASVRRPRLRRPPCGKPPIRGRACDPRLFIRPRLSSARPSRAPRKRPSGFPCAPRAKSFSCGRICPPPDRPAHPRDVPPTRAAPLQNPPQNTSRTPLSIPQPPRGTFPFQKIQNKATKYENRVDIFQKIPL